MRIAILILLVFVALCGQTFCQEASELSAESKGVLSILSEVKEADKDDLHILAARLKAFPAGAVDQTLRIKAAALIGDRFLKLELPKSAIPELSYALSLPHPNDESSRGCANMWGMAMDTLLVHLNRSAQHEKILPTLEKYTTHSNSVCFKATFYDLKCKWLRNAGEAEASTPRCGVP